MPNGYIKKKNGQKIEIVDLAARNRLDALEAGGNNGVFKVTFTFDWTYENFKDIITNIECDKTAVEIEDAYDKGMYVYAVKKHGNKDMFTLDLDHTQDVDFKYFYIRQGHLYQLDIIWADSRGWVSQVTSTRYSDDFYVGVLDFEETDEWEPLADLYTQELFYKNNVFTINFIQSGKIFYFTGYDMNNSTPHDNIMIYQYLNHVENEYGILLLNTHSDDDWAFDSITYKYKLYPLTSSLTETEVNTLIDTKLAAIGIAEEGEY